MSPSRQRGFTLLEAIVAITIFSTSALGLYAWINSMLIGTSRFDAIAVETADRHSAMDYLKVINPMEAPNGRQDLGEIKLQWNSELVEPVQRGRTIDGWEFGLYDVLVQLERPGVHEQQFTLRQVGYRALAVGEGSIGI